MRETLVVALLVVTAFGCGGSPAPEPTPVGNVTPAQPEDHGATAQKWNHDKTNA
jgi:hypothetical protein